MKSFIAIALAASGIAFASLPASAGERMNDAALGAGSGCWLLGR